MAMAMAATPRRQKATADATQPYHHTPAELRRKLIQLVRVYSTLIQRPDGTVKFGRTVLECWNGYLHRTQLSWLSLPGRNCISLRLPVLFERRTPINLRGSASDKCGASSQSGARAALSLSAASEVWATHDEVKC